MRTRLRRPDERRGLRPLVAAIAIGSLAATLGFSGVRPHGTRHVAGNWQFRLTLSSGSSAWEATVRQKATHLSGTVQRDEVDCRAKIGGTVTGSKVKMTWTVQVPCTGEKLTLTGRMTGPNKMAGTVMDSKLGKGKFGGSRDT